MELISSRRNPLIVQIAQLSRDKMMRRQQGTAILHGTKLVLEAKRLGYRIRTLLITESELSRRPNLPQQLEAEQVFLITESVVDRVSPMRSPQGIIALINAPPVRKIEDLLTLPLLAAFSAMQDPENVGAALRSAAAFGVSGVLMDAVCADPFSPQSLRSSMGAALAVPIACVPDIGESVATLKNAGQIVLATSLTDSSEDLRETVKGIPQDAHVTVLIGNEGAGLPEQLVRSCSAVVRIPMSQQVESLNAAAAAAILFWELNRRKL